MSYILNGRTYAEAGDHAPAECARARAVVDRLMASRDRRWCALFRSDPCRASHAWQHANERIERLILTRAYHSGYGICMGRVAA